MNQTMDVFLVDLRLLTERWKADISNLEEVGEHRLAGQVRSWIAEAEGVIAAHEGVHA